MKVRLIIKRVEIPPVGDVSITTYHTILVEIPDEESELLKEGSYTHIGIIGAEILENDGTVRYIRSFSESNKETNLKDILEGYVKIDDICNPSSRVMQIIKQNLKGDE